MRSHVVNVDDVGMIQSGRRASFLLEAAQAVGIRRKPGGKNFDGNVASQAVVAGAINLSHASSAHLRLDFIGSDFCACG